jgi:hypothetical protein
MFVVSSDKDSGGTWAGAKEALARDYAYAYVAVWAGTGAKEDNAALASRGATPITEVAELFELEPASTPRSRTRCSEPGVGGYIGKGSVASTAVEELTSRWLLESLD